MDVLSSVSGEKHLEIFQVSTLKYLNLGCGRRFHRDWTNIDFAPSSPYVQAYDLRQGVPFPDNTFDVVYHSHLLEHFPKQGALSLLQECYRVLKPLGIIRVAVPDLERIARLYLQALEKALQGDSEWQSHYEWMMLELYDQAVRDHPGGAMLQYFGRDPIPNKAFVYERIGGEARHIIQALQTRQSQNGRQRLRIRDLIFRARHLPHFVRAWSIKRLLCGEDRKALQIGQFRSQGEIHQWMYDRYSLARLLERAGFHNPVQRTAFESAIGNWVQFHLDTEPDGATYKPDSLYMEASKPAA
jgi:predicted SAM-dependent methyltransferase